MKKQTPKQTTTKKTAAPLREEQRVDMMKVLNETLLRSSGCTLAEATEKQIYRALCTAVRELLNDKNLSLIHI